VWEKFVGSRSGTGVWRVDEVLENGDREVVRDRGDEPGT